MITKKEIKQIVGEFKVKEGIMTLSFTFRNNLPLIDLIKFYDYCFNIKFMGVEIITNYDKIISYDKYCTYETKALAKDKR